MRDSWDTYFMNIARLVATRATCIRRRVGCVAVRNRRILATGYNGAPAGLDHCDQVGCLREELQVPSGQRHELCRAVHAEQNAIIQAATHGVQLSSASLYITHTPCSICAKMLINAGIREVVTADQYADALARKLLSAADINCREIQK